jgi:uncharacterized protein with von Willebrand factor type A (vWA) domain
VAIREPIHGLLSAARRAGVRISTAESIDAFEALDLVGYDDRRTLRDTLGIVLAKTEDERAILDRCFDAYFSSEALAFDDPAAGPAAELTDEDREVTEAARESPLARMLLDEDMTSLVLALQRATREADIDGVRVFTQIGPFARRILDALGVAGLDAAIGQLRGSGSAAAGIATRFLAGRRGALAERARDIVERRLALYGGGERNQLRDAFLRDLRLTNVDRRDVERMRTLVRAMARRIATRYGRRRKRARRGHLDVRRTLRRNVGHDGVPFQIAWKRRAIEKPRVVALCDVSGSVASIAHFLLLFLYALNEALSDIRSFAFSSDLIEVSAILEREAIDDAIAQIMRPLGFRSSDYGRSFDTFARNWMTIVDRKTTVVILGDGRTNYGDPRTDVVKQLYERAHRVIWLNPEYRSTWGTGDSEMFGYAAHCHVASVCNRLADLERVVVHLLR